MCFLAKLKNGKCHDSVTKTSIILFFFFFPEGGLTAALIYASALTRSGGIALQVKNILCSISLLNVEPAPKKLNCIVTMSHMIMKGQ